MTAIFISQVDIKSPELFAQYIEKSKQIASQFGAELIAQGQFEKSISGTPAAHRIGVVVRFPSLSAIHDWHESDAYQALIALRDEASTQHISIYQEPEAPAEQE